MATILLVDGNADAAADLRDVLSAGGHDVTHAVNGIAGLQRLMTARFDLIVVARAAMRMPGPDFMQRVRQYSPGPGILIVLTGGSSGQEDVDAVFGPSFSEEVFLATVNRLLRRARAMPLRRPGTRQITSN